MLGVVLAGEGLGHAQEPRAAELQPPALEPRDDLTCEPAGHAVGLHEHECRLPGHAGRESSQWDCRGARAAASA